MRAEFLLAMELEKIYKLLFKLTEESDLCKTCEYYPGYQANGHCLNYHPDSKIPEAKF